MEAGPEDSRTMPREAEAGTTPLLRINVTTRPHHVMFRPLPGDMRPVSRALDLVQLDTGLVLE